MSTIGPQRPGDRRGWLVFEWLPADLQRAEDATQHADYERRRSRTTRHCGCAGAGSGTASWQREFDPARGREVWCLIRPATPAERALLAHLGHTLPMELDTRVEFLTETLRQRRWPQLETEGDAA